MPGLIHRESSLGGSTEDAVNIAIKAARRGQRRLQMNDVLATGGACEQGRRENIRHDPKLGSSETAPPHGWP